MIRLAPKKDVPEKQVEILAVDAAEAARMLGVCDRTVRNLARRGEIACKKVGWRSIFPVASIKAFLESTDAE